MDKPERTRSPAWLLSMLALVPEYRAQEALDQIGGLRGLLDFEESALLQVDALAGSPDRGQVLGAAVELARRLIREPIDEERVKVASSRQVAAYFQPLLAHNATEELWIAVLDGKAAIQRTFRVATGWAHSAAAPVPAILRPAIAMGARGFVMVHNHPSNDPTPSREDVEMTEQVAVAGHAGHLRLLDHVIVTPCGKHSSMLDLGYVPSFDR